jgi:putative phage-type endonuclease
MLITCSDLRVRAGSKNWLAARNTGIGASEIAMALGIAPPSWGSPTSLYYRKRGVLPDARDNVRMLWGRELESTILRRFLKCHPEFREGPHLTGRLYRSKAREWQLATPDAVVFDNRQGFAFDKSPEGVRRTTHGWPVLVEVKTGASRDEWGEEGTDEIPVYYRAQVMQSMDVIGARVAWVPVLFNGRDYREYRVARDPKDIAILRAKGEAFWRMVQEGTPPDVDGLEATTKAMRIAFGVEPERTVQVPHELVMKIERAKVVQKRANELRARLENELRAALGDAAVGLAGPVLLAKRSTFETSVVDLVALREEHPELVEKFTRKEPRQRLTTYRKDMA